MFGGILCSLMLFNLPNLNGDSALKQRLSDELIKNGVIQSCHIGPVGVKSLWFAKADSLIQMLSFAEQSNYYQNCNNYTIKYYLFAALCRENMDTAFDLFKSSLSDSSEVFTTFGCVWNSMPFNCLLAREYGVNLNLHNKGGIISYNCHTYAIEHMDIKKRKKEFEKILKQKDWKEIIDYLKARN